MLIFVQMWVINREFGKNDIRCEPIEGLNYSPIKV